MIAAEPHTRANRLWDAYFAAFNAMTDVARDVGLPIHGQSDLSQLYNAGHRLARYWRGRTEKTERALRACLASDILTDEQRGFVLRVLHGQQSVGRDLKSLNDTERKLIDHYRAGSQADKQMLRTLLARFVEPARGAR